MQLSERLSEANKIISVIAVIVKQSWIHIPIYIFWGFMEMFFIAIKSA